jgi:hypothetical protein
MYGSQSDIKNTIRWESKSKSDIWDSFYQVANDKNGKPKVMCKACLCTIGHPRFRRAGSSPMTIFVIRNLVEAVPDIRFAFWFPSNCILNIRLRSILLRIQFDGNQKANRISGTASTRLRMTKMESRRLCVLSCKPPTNEFIAYVLHVITYRIRWI